MNFTKTIAQYVVDKKNWQKLLAALVLFWAPIIIFSKIAGEILENEPFRFDKSILYSIHSFSTPFLDRLFILITTIAGPLYLSLIALAILGYLIYKKQKLNALFIFFGVGGAAASNFVLKLLFHRERPSLWHGLVVETSYSFPSGHSMISMALVACIVIMLWSTRWRMISLIIGAIIVGLVGLSRLYLGVHYPTDVIAGWSIGLAWVVIIMVILRKYSHRLQRTEGKIIG